MSQNLTITNAINRAAKLEKLRAARWRGRTDLFWLAREVLGYRDIDDEVHGPIRDIVQSFPLPPEEDQRKLDVLTPVGWNYVEPWLPAQHLSGGRRRLILDPRGFFKSTLNVICHSIQWLLNYPDITILIVHGVQDIADDMISEIRGHFLKNRVLRDIYPDYCVDSGVATRYTLPNRRKIRKEPSVGIGSIGSVRAGSHYDVIKFTDIVNEQNTLNRDQIAKVNQAFMMYRNILVSPSCWIDVEGTTYDFADTYQDIIEREQKLTPNERQWRIHIRGAWKKDTGGAPYTFLPEERELRDLVDDTGRKISWFPKKFPYEELERMRRDNEIVFASQQLNNPVDTGDAKPFPITKLRTKAHEEMRKVPMAYYTTTVDLAEVDNAGADYSVLLTCGWDGYGRCYVVDARHGRFMPDDVIRQLFDVYDRWKPRAIKIEETGYVRGLKTSIGRHQDLTGKYLPLLYIPRDNEKSKIERILLTLQPWYHRGDIIFDDSLPCFEQFRQELTRFPKGKNDDLIDALSDQFQEKQWSGREAARPTDEKQFDTYLADSMEKAFEFKLAKPSDNPGPEPAQASFWDITGGL